MEIQLITMDMDGTTFQDDHVTIPPRNITALRAAAERGIAVAITTGRAWSQVQEAAEQLGCISWAVTANAPLSFARAESRSAPLSKEREKYSSPPRTANRA